MDICKNTKTGNNQLIQIQTSVIPFVDEEQQMVQMSMKSIVEMFSWKLLKLQLHYASNMTLFLDELWNMEL